MKQRAAVRLGSRSALLMAAVIVSTLAACQFLVGLDGISDGPPLLDRDAHVTRDAPFEGSVPPDASAVEAADSAADAPPPECDLTKPFGSIAPLAALNTAAYETGARLAHDDLTLYFARTATGGEPQIYTATRATPDGAFGNAKALSGVVNTAAGEAYFTTASNELLGFFHSNRPTADPFDIYRATRTTTVADWGNVMVMSSVSTSVSDGAPWLQPDGRALYFDRRMASGTDDIFRADVDALGNVSPAVSIPGLVNTTASEANAVATPDERTLYFARVVGFQHIFVATRGSVGDPWGSAVPVPELNSSADDRPTWISADGCRILFASERANASGGTSDLYSAVKPR